jgi:general stress protein YciG
MATTKNSTSQKEMDNTNNHSSKGNFANMDKKDLKETAAKGGRSHGSNNRSQK